MKYGKYEQSIFTSDEKKAEGKLTRGYVFVISIKVMER